MMSQMRSSRCRFAARLNFGVRASKEARCILITSFFFFAFIFLFLKFSLRIKYSIGLNGRNSLTNMKRQKGLIGVDSRASAEKG